MIEEDEKLKKEIIEARMSDTSRPIAPNLSDLEKADKYAERVNKTSAANDEKTEAVLVDEKTEAALVGGKKSRKSRRRKSRKSHHKKSRKHRRKSHRK